MISYGRECQICYPVCIPDCFSTMINCMNHGKQQYIGITQIIGETSFQENPVSLKLESGLLVVLNVLVIGSCTFF